MGIGRFRERVKVIEVVQGQPDGIGGFLTEKNTVGTYWAMVEESDGSRTFESSRVSNKNPVEITMRAGSYRVTADNLLEHDGVELTILSVRRDQEKRYTICQCQTSLA